jgi:predicted DNA-binding transcriptional regulator AlpA
MWSYRRHKGFPAPILLGGKRLRWRLADVEAWLAAQQLHSKAA